jgi:hypothetical protein
MHVASTKALAATTAHFVLCDPLIGMRVLCSPLRTVANVQTALLPKIFPNRTDLFRGNRKMIAPLVPRSCGRSNSRRENERSRVLYYWKPISCSLPSPKTESQALHAVSNANRSSVDKIKNVFEPVHGCRSGFGLEEAKAVAPDSPLQQLAQSRSRLVHLRF